VQVSPDVLESRPPVSDKKARPSLLGSRNFESDKDKGVQPLLLRVGLFWYAISANPSGGCGVFGMYNVQGGHARGLPPLRYMVSKCPPITSRYEGLSIQTDYCYYIYYYNDYYYSYFW